MDLTFVKSINIFDGYKLEFPDKIRTIILLKVNVFLRYMRNNFLVYICLIACFVGHTYTKNIFAVCLKFNLMRHTIFIC